MQITFKIFLLLLLNLSLFAFDIDKRSSNIAILSKATVFYDDKNIVKEG